MTFPTITVTPGRMTEAEARVLGATATRIANVRHLRDDCAKGASITVATSNGTVALALSQTDAQAVLSLLVERDACFLASFDVALDSPSDLLAN